MWQSYGKGKTRAQLQAAHDTTSVAKGQKCHTCGLIKPLDCFSYPDRPECKWCNTDYRVGLNTKTVAQADRNGLPWTPDEDTFIKKSCEAGWTDERMALHLKRTLMSVRNRRARVLGINKRLQAAPKPLYCDFGLRREKLINQITVVPDDKRKRILVYCNTATTWDAIRAAFLQKGLTVDDFKAWMVGVTAGA